MKKIPLRKCTGCQTMKPKNELMRIVRSDTGEFSLDFTGKKAGRGAYVCKTAECLEKAHKSRGLERSFKAAVPKELYEQMRAELQTALKTESEAQNG